MKQAIKYITVVLAMMIATQQFTFAQDVAKNDRKAVRKASVNDFIESKHFVFNARTVSPTGGGTRQLTSYYDLRVKGDTIVCYLPYFGRAYSAPIGPSEAGINFTSTDFKYETSPRRKGGWNISIRPNDVHNVQQLNLSISENGQASLQVTSNNRQPISFMGTIEAGRK